MEIKQLLHYRIRSDEGNEEKKKSVKGKHAIEKTTLEEEDEDEEKEVKEEPVSK